MMLRVLHADDEPLARQRVADLLEEIGDIEVVALCEDGEDAVRTIVAERPDVVLLDVQMPGMNGFEVVEALGAEEMPVVVFVTAHDEFALRAFDAHAIDYLLKPVAPDRFRHALERARAQVMQRRQGAAPPDLRALLETLAGRAGMGLDYALRRRGPMTMAPSQLGLFTHLFSLLLPALGAQQAGLAYKRKDDIYRMAQANKAFAHYRW